MMDDNTTSEASNSTLQSGEGSKRPVWFDDLEDREYRRIFNILGLYVNVPITVFGILGNVLNTIVIYKSGLHKTSNILIWSLAIGDAFFLWGELSITGRIYAAGDYIGWGGSYTVGFFQFVLWKFHSFSYVFGNFCSMSIPVLITAERLVATLAPLKFNTVVTPKRIWLGVGICVSLGFTQAFVLEIIGYRFHYWFNPELNRSIGAKVGQPKLKYLVPFERYMNLSMSMLKGIVAVIFVTIGCVVIGFKLQQTGKKRKEITSKSTDTNSRTTLMLFLVCVVYVIANGIYSLRQVANFYPPLRKAIDLFKGTVMDINSSFNIIIYAGVNKNFRDIYREILTCKPCKKTMIS